MKKLSIENECFIKTIKFNIYGLTLFIITMIPNFIWFFIKAPHDILRTESITPTLDLVATIVQVIMIFFLCFSTRENNKISRYPIISVTLYFLCWMVYFLGIVHALVIIGLCLFPCLAFLLYEIKTKNWIAIIPTSIFTVLHLISGIINFI